MAKAKRNYKAEYAHRMSRGRAKGISRSQARGHPKLKEISVSSKRPSAKVSPERLRRYAAEREIIERHGRRWVVRHELPRRMLLFSDGRTLHVVVGDFDAASKIGRFMSAVGEFLKTNKSAGLREFEGISVIDVSGKTHVFETRANALYRLASAHDQSFEHIYRIVI